MHKNIEKYTIEYYLKEDGRKPFVDWATLLIDQHTRKKIFKYISRILAGNLGNYRRLKGGIFEIKLFFGPGYRIYCSFISLDTILILCAGTKETQEKDIKRAQKYYQEYTNTNRGNKNGKERTL